MKLSNYRVLFERRGWRDRLTYRDKTAVYISTGKVLKPSFNMPLRKSI